MANAYNGDKLRLISPNFKTDMHENKSSCILTGMFRIFPEMFWLRSCKISRLKINFFFSAINSINVRVTMVTLNGISFLDITCSIDNKPCNLFETDPSTQKPGGGEYNFYRLFVFFQNKQPFNMGQIFSEKTPKHETHITDCSRPHFLKH